MKLLTGVVRTVQVRTTLSLVKIAYVNIKMREVVITSRTLCNVVPPGKGKFLLTEHWNVGRLKSKRKVKMVNITEKIKEYA